MRTPNYICVVCGKEHYQRPNQIAKTVNGLTCSKECGKINRAKHMTGKGNHQFNVKGEANASFKGDTKISTYGYILKYKPEHKRANHAGYVWEHLLIMEEHIGRPLAYYGVQHKSNEICHHIDRNKQNNKIENLQLMTLGEHSALHARNDKERFLKAGNSQKKFDSNVADKIISEYKQGGITHKELSLKYECSQSVVSNIINKKRYCYGKE